jgi:DNA-binding winged helix-turn-helix (wHTH) protein
MPSGTTAKFASFHAGRILVDRHARVVLVDGKPAKLGGRAYDLLDALMQRRDRVVPSRSFSTSSGPA